MMLPSLLAFDECVRYRDFPNIDPVIPSYRLRLGFSPLFASVHSRIGATLAAR